MRTHPPSAHQESAAYWLRFRFCGALWEGRTMMTDPTLPAAVPLRLPPRSAYAAPSSKSSKSTQRLKSSLTYYPIRPFVPLHVCMKDLTADIFHRPSRQRRRRCQRLGTALSIQAPPSPHRAGITNLEVGGGLPPGHTVLAHFFQDSQLERKVIEPGLATKSAPTMQPIGRHPAPDRGELKASLATCSLKRASYLFM